MGVSLGEGGWGAVCLAPPEASPWRVGNAAAVQHLSNKARWFPRLLVDTAARGGRWKSGMLAVLARVSRRAAFAALHLHVPPTYPYLSCPSDFHDSRVLAGRELEYSYSPICAHLRTGCSAWACRLCQGLSWDTRKRIRIG